ncbi:MAG: hypothetical protein ACRD3M_14755 [Thermoanaerobaculia bacterium]
MAVVLLSTTALALAGLLFTSVQGFSVEAGVAAAGTLVPRHVGYAIPTVLLSLFSQSMVIFYFIGTGRLVKDEIGGYPEEQRRAILRALSDFKRRTSPPATFALLSAIGVFVLGGAVHTRALPTWTHLAASLLAVGLHFWALFAEWRVFGENNALMNDPRVFAARAAGGGP